MTKPKNKVCLTHGKWVIDGICNGGHLRYDRKEVDTCYLSTDPGAVEAVQMFHGGTFTFLEFQNLASQWHGKKFIFKGEIY